MEKVGIAIRVRKLLIENGFDREQADVLAMVLDDIYHSQMEHVATKEDIKMLMQMMDKRFKEVNKRFEELLHHVDKHFEEMLHYVDKRIEAVDRRFEDINKRFEDLNKRITFLQWFIFLLFTAYTGIMAFFIRYLVLSIR